VSAWQHDCESRSYVELIRHDTSLQEVKTRRSARIRQESRLGRDCLSNLSLIELSESNLELEF
jgi:hypothetical protein